MVTRERQHDKYVLNTAITFTTSSAQDLLQKRQLIPAGSNVALTLCFIRFALLLNVALLVLWLLLVVMPFWVKPPVTFRWSQLTAYSAKRIAQGFGLDNSFLLYGAQAARSMHVSGSPAKMMMRPHGAALSPLRNYNCLPADQWSSCRMQGYMSKRRHVDLFYVAAWLQADTITSTSGTDTTTLRWACQTGTSPFQRTWASPSPSSLCWSSPWSCCCTPLAGACRFMNDRLPALEAHTAACAHRRVRSLCMWTSMRRICGNSYVMNLRDH